MRKKICLHIGKYRFIARNLSSLYWHYLYLSRQKFNVKTDFSKIKRIENMQEMQNTIYGFDDPPSYKQLFDPPSYKQLLDPPSYKKLFDQGKFNRYLLCIVIQKFRTLKESVVTELAWRSDNYSNQRVTISRKQRRESKWKPPDK